MDFLFGSCNGCRETVSEVVVDLPTLLTSRRQYKSAEAKPAKSLQADGTSESTQVSASAIPAVEAQQRFEVLPVAEQKGWLGGDSDVSLVIGGGPTGRRALWIFADTFISTYDASTQTRVYNGYSMPHSTLGLVEMTESGCTGQVEYIWQTDAAGQLVSFFEPSSEQKVDGELLWPVAGIASRDGRSAVLLAQRIKGFLTVVGTTLIILPDVASVDDPRQWKYTTLDVGSADLTWFSSIFFADAEGDTVYIFGHGPGADGSAPTQSSPTVLARACLADLLDQNWERTEYWVAPGAWSASPDNFQVLEVPSWETTCIWSKELSLWYSFNIEAFGSEIFLWTAEDITGTWTKTSIYQIPAPFNASPYINYAAKAHPELVQQTCVSPADYSTGTGEKEVELVLSFVSNVFGTSSEGQSTGNLLFGKGQMAWPVRAYWPRFLRVTAKRSQ
eukprot:CAMPEP_0115203094 /NCGR_PEP_ID=MMETSP0270-20121206/18469_1 /TAXON_ID=71861 /ORGANISM="Scrippsiella trochoidea, Strain CCMP3099" /LENGTH=445 /DNA_ID=CAMNT_0002616537 /DNA_START=86 /DNA_END=1423 /DNA_ORIENTATION=-